MRRTALLVLILVALLLLLCSRGRFPTLKPQPPAPRKPALQLLGLARASPTRDTCGFGFPGSGTTYRAAPGLCASTYAVQGHVAMAVWAEQGDHVVVAVWRGPGGASRPMSEFGPPVALRQGQVGRYFFEAVAPEGQWAPDVAEVRTWRLWLPLMAQ